MKITLLCLIAVVSFSKTCCAYETPTHAFITKEAFDRSVLTVNSTELYARLGFERLNPNQPFETGFPDGCVGPASIFERDSAYVDARGTWLVGSNMPPDSGNVFFRCPLNYERRDMPPEYSGRTRNAGAVPAQPGPTPQLRFEGWLMRGVIREDDVEASFYTVGAGPDADPWGEKTRVYNHFYSPVTNSTDSNQIVLVGGGPALPWAMGEVYPFENSQIPDPMRGNHFSYMDARRAYYYALTYKQPTQSANNAFTDYRVRMSLWSTTLKSLGHVVHLLQDQASPQHSRGEPHNHVCTGGIPGALNQDLATRTYENFINYRLTSAHNQQTPNDKYLATNDCEEALWLGLFQLGGQNPAASIAPWRSNVYPVPQFSIQRKFFTTRNATDQTVPLTLPLGILNARGGLGDYANRGFYTQDYQAGHYLSPPAANSPQFVEGTAQIMQIPGLGQLKVTNLFWQVPDPVQPGFADQGLVNGRAPIISQTVWCRLTNMGCTDMTMLSLQNYNQMADMLIPRSIAYSAGMINFFFRGKLEIEPIDQKIFAVLNQGEPHTVNADGYPIRTSDGKIFGFDKIRLKVRNSTEVITESGTGAVVQQTVGVGKLVAVARYHRNACYKADLTGERQSLYAPPPQLIVDEPACAGNLPTRTAYQEISVSAPMDITSPTDLPGGTGSGATAVEKIFDFSMDPIPVNATDLFIQVVYRGVLGAETDGIAVGTLDIREPTYYAAWNNTDYFYNEAFPMWVGAAGNFPARAIQGIRVCAGAPSKLVYQYNINLPQPGLAFPFPGFSPPGVLRLAFLFATPVGLTRISYRSTPIMSMATPASPSAPQRPGFTTGQQRQASKEFYPESGTGALPAPSNCGVNPPAAGANVWCNDPVDKRRGLAFGAIGSPLYYTNLFSGNDAPDVDIPPALPVFTTQTMRTGGTIEFDNAVLQNCPPAPTLSAEGLRELELREAAWDLGVDLDAIEKRP